MGSIGIDTVAASLPIASNKLMETKGVEIKEIEERKVIIIKMPMLAST